jgi:hypothetical protein
LRGCLAPGLSVGADKESVLSSRLAFQKLVDYLGGWDTVWELEIVNIIREKQ